MIIVSDLWGKDRSEWIELYTTILKQKFDLFFYNSCLLGDVDKSVYDQHVLHQQFVRGGIDTAFKHLSKLEKHPIHILAFSVGGTIAWKYGLQTGNIISLTCVSSTRLRKETEKPIGDINLYFGEEDEYTPNVEWFKKMGINSHIIPSKGHQMYLETDFAEKLCHRMLAQGK